MRVLFVCLGNICRSPTAEAVFRKKFSEMGLNAHFDSAATSNYHIGDKSDPRSIHHAELRNYEMTHLGRQISQKDFSEFDHIFVMDQSNLENVFKVCPPGFENKVSLLTKYAKNKNYQMIPDPYHGQAADFEHVIDIIEDCVDGFAKIAREKNK